MSTSSVTPATTPAAMSCPACARRGVATSLSVGAALDGAGCAQCGGVLLPSIGSERLLHDELALSRATLLEIAQGFGGHRFNCPSCTSRMRPLLLRGVDVDLCFHCGALWLDDGELEGLSSQRYRSTPRTAIATTASTTSTALALPDAVVRFPAAHPARRLLADVTGIASVVVGAAHLVGFAGQGALVAMGALATVWLGLRNHRVVDVFPRARRLLRSRGFLTTGPRDAGAEHLDDVRFVVVRPAWLLTETALVDSVGRTIVTIDLGTAHAAVADVEGHARRLGAVPLVHPAVADTTKPSMPPTTTTTSPWAPSHEHVVTIVPIATHGPHLQLDGVRNGRAVWVLKNAVPARGDEGNRFDLGFYVCGLDGAVLARFHDDGHGTVVVVGADGEALASIHRRSLGPFPLHEIVRARSPRRLRLLPTGFGAAVIVDDELERHAAIADHALHLRQTGDDEALLCLLLFAHTLIETLDTLPQR